MMEAIWNALVDFADWLVGLVKAVFLSVWDFCVDVICYVFDKVLQFAVDAMSAIDVSAVQSASGWGSLPGDVINIVGLIGLGDCMAIIGAAIAIRLAMQLIPFVRLGS